MSKLKILALLGFLFAFIAPVFAQTIKGNVSPIMNAGRVVDWKEITADSLPFTRNGSPFSLFLTPKLGSTAEVEVVQLRGYQGNTVKEVPLIINAWNVIAASHFPTQSVNTSLFTNYRVFLGFGQTSD